MTSIDFEEWVAEQERLKAHYCNDIVAGLCKGRHQLPEEVTEYVFPQELDPLDVDGMTQTAIQFLEDHHAKSLTLYVTGLTVACIAVIKAGMERGIPVVCMHYDRESGNYYPQKVF